MCDRCRHPTSFIQCQYNYRNYDIRRIPQQWQSLQVPCNSNHASTTTQTQTCHHHTQTQSQCLIRTTSPTHRILTYDPDTFHRPSPAPSPCPCQQNNHSHNHNNRHTLESLLRDLLNHTVCDTDTVPDCAACHALCHAPSQSQQELQQCNACIADQQQLASLLLNLLERINANSHDHRTRPTGRLQNHNTNANRHQRARCDYQPQPHCDTCITTHEQTRTLIDVLFRITRRRSRGRTYTQTSTRCRRCTHSHSHSRSRSPVYTRPTDNDLWCVIRRLLDEIENGNSIRCCDGCGAAECREYLDGNVSRLRRIVRDIEGEADEFDEDVGGRCGYGCGCGRGEECVEISRVTAYDGPERRRPRVGNLHVGWVF